MLTQEVITAAQEAWALLARSLMTTGELSWNLTRETQHRAGSVLTITFTIRNTTNAQRCYQIYFGLFELSGPVITTWPWSENFCVQPMDEQSFTVSQQIEYSDCVLQASLYDLETGSMGAALQTILEQPASVVEQFSPAIIMMGVLGAAVPIMLKD